MSPKMRAALPWIITGVVVPIGILCTPIVYKYYNPDEKLEYYVTGPLDVKSNTMLSVRIENGGSKVERNVRLGIRVDPVAVTDAPLTDQIVMDAAMPTTLVREGAWYVVGVGDLRPSEDANVKLFSRSIRVTGYGRLPPEGLWVKSDERVGKFVSRQSEPWGVSTTWFAMSLVCAFVYVCFVIFKVAETSGRWKALEEMESRGKAKE